MKFHGIAMAGPFVNQKLPSLPVFDATRDQARMVWLTDGTIWYGSDVEWVNFASGSGGDASEVEDLYSDLLRTTIFLNASYDGFIDPNLDLVESTTMTYVPKSKRFDYSTGQILESANLFDDTLSMSYVDYVMVYVDYFGGTPLIEVSSNGGVNWNAVNNHKIFRIPDNFVGTDLRIRFTGSGNGSIYSWGVLYNKDLSASCTKYGLTYKKFEANSGQSTFGVDYTPGAIQVFLNGDLVDDTDIVATSGTEIEFDQPLQDGDIVYVISYSTSTLDQNVNFNDFVRHDGSIPFTDDQSMGDNKLTDVADGVDTGDAVNVGQLNNFVRHDGSIPFTDDQSMGDNKLTDVADGVDTGDAVNVGQLNNFGDNLSLSILKAITMGTWEGDYHVNYTSNSEGLITNIDISIPSLALPTWVANIVYTYNSNDLPSTVTYTFGGKTITQTYVFDSNDLPDYMTQVTV